MSPLLSVKSLNKQFPIREKKGFFRSNKYLSAINNVSFDIHAGETLGLVGESGCGKSTLSKTLLNLYKPTSGEVLFKGENIFTMNRQAKTALCRHVQMIFQDPMESLNPRHTINDILEEPLIIHHIGNRQERLVTVLKLLDRVGLPRDSLHRYPHEFSGGQRQRIGIARAIALEPELLICDEPVSALDVSVQSQILNLLLDLQQDMGLALLFISHDLNVVRHVSDRIAVMYLGEIVELASTEQLFNQPKHPYTRALLQSIPNPSSNHFTPINGEIPSPIQLPSGCHFHTRCAHRQEQCMHNKPALTLDVQSTPHRQFRCHYPLDNQ